MNDPFFTLIIPTFNSEMTLSRTLDSIVQQEYSEWEVWVVDGLSSDKTLSIIKRYASGDPRINFFSEKDLGIYDAMNKGILRAKGRWLYFLGSNDELFDNNVLKQTHERLAKKPVDFLYGDVEMDGNKRYDGVFNFHKLLKKNIGHQGIFYKRELFKKIGTYIIHFKLHADWAFNIRCFQTPDISIDYFPRLVAKFAAGGVSSAHDTRFLNDMLIPLRLQELRSDSNLLRGLKNYDEYWRLFRNAQIKSIEEVGVRADLPSKIVSMINFQRLFPLSILRIGFFSKSLMLVSFLLNFLRR
jgi:glycosyltransferase involved in cell wall biosynthesis